MRLLPIMFLRIPLAMLLACGYAHAADEKPWAKHCTLEGIPSASDKGEFGKILKDFKERCLPEHACVLSCMRSKCPTPPGGCFHACGPSDYGPPEVLANMYAAKDPKVCPAPAPNNSLKRTAAGRLR